MFCPNCKTEYRSGFTQCSDCGATLVAELNSDSADQDVALAWRGTDPAGFSAAQAALDGAGIRSFPLDEHDHLVEGLAIARPRYGLLVSKSDLDTALELVASIQDRSAFGMTSSTPSESPEGFSSDAGTDADETPDDLYDELDPKCATAGVWAGSQSMAETLRACLRENGIDCALKPQGAATAVFVIPVRADRAREIIREVIEATPPE